MVQNYKSMIMTKHKAKVMGCMAFGFIQENIIKKLGPSWAKLGKIRIKLNFVSWVELFMD